MKVKSITEKLPQSATLPDGIYYGSWGGYVITVNYNNKTFELETEEGVRGIDVRVVVAVKDNVATFETLSN